VRPPFASWLFAYRREWLIGDVLGGLTAAAVVIPKVLAYGIIAGLTVEAGLYTALAAMLVYPLFGSSRLLIVSTSSSLAMLLATTVAAASQTRGLEPAAVAGTLVLLVGATMMAGSLLRLGFLANFISLPVLIGFQAGVGIVIIVGQLAALLGVAAESTTTIGTLLELTSVLPQAHALTALIGGAALVMIFVLQRFFPRVPIPLLLLAASIVVSLVAGLEAAGVATVGAFPPGLPALSVPDLSLATALWPAAAGIALMSFTESITAARASWSQGDPPVSANRELFALGAANSAAALVGGLPSDGAVSHTAIAKQGGARSQLAQWASAAAVVVTLLFLSRPIAALPKPALAAVIIFIAVGMVKLEPFRAIARVRRTELAWALVTVAGVVLIGTLEGILIAVAISVLTLIYQANRPAVYALAYDRAHSVFRRAGEQGAGEVIPGLLLLRVEGRLMFANAENVGDQVRALVEHAKPRVIVLDCSGIPDIEYSALVMLAEADHRLRERGVALWLAGVSPDVLPVLVRSTLPVAADASRVFPDLHKALEAWEALRVSER
jgi:SulP family sulfate permease